MIFARRGGCNYKDIMLQNIVGGWSLWRNIFLRGFSCFKLHYHRNITISSYYNEHVDISTILYYIMRSYIVEEKIIAHYNF